MASEALATIVRILRARPVAANATPQEMRAGFEAMAGSFPMPAGAAHQEIDAGGVPAEWVRGAASDETRTILYLHGGGYVVGSPRTHRSLAARIADAAAARALVIDYRLGPEHPHPAAVEDATAAYRWLLSQGADPTRTVVAGDSAGGGLTVAALVALRDAGDPLPAAGVCLSPWVDLECVGESMTTRADEDAMVQRSSLLELARAYLGRLDPRTPLAAPLHADLTGLPPLLVQVGTAEVLLDDATRLAARAEQAGVDVTLERWEEMIHVWQIFGGLLPEADQAIARIGEFTRERGA
jgi:epsilon-lactone hydrolase